MVSNLKYALLFSLFLMAGACCCSKGDESENKNTGNTTPTDTEKYDLNISDITMRDPFIFVDKTNKLYYLQINGGEKNIICYKSKDLKMWKKMGASFTATPEFWGQRDFWAPDMFQYKGKYYILATFSNETSKRGTSFLVSDFPDKGFQPLENKAITPTDWTCLDATLYIDDNQTPWLLYCREWLEVKDGQVVIQQLSTDLKQTVGEPRILFTAAKAPWTGPISGSGVTGYVTDAPFIYRAYNGELLIIWSSFAKNGKYAIGVTRSDNGQLSGKWTHDTAPLNNDDGGHAMIFKDIQGRLMISYHAPNTHPTYAVIKELTDDNGHLTIVQ